MSTLRLLGSFPLAAVVASRGLPETHLVESDHVQHAHGPPSDESYWGASYSDDRIRDLVEAIEASPMAESTMSSACETNAIRCIWRLSRIQLWKVRTAPADEWLLARGEMISRWPVRTGVLADRGAAYFGAGIFPHENVYLCAVDCRGGKLLWKQDSVSESSFDRSDLSPQGHLLLQGGVLYVPSGRTLPAPVGRRDGRVLDKPSKTWRFAKPGGGDIGGSEALLADDQIHSFGAREIFTIDGVAGELGYAWFVGQQLGRLRVQPVGHADADPLRAGDRAARLMPIVNNPCPDSFLKKGL